MIIQQIIWLLFEHNGETFKPIVIRGLQQLDRFWLHSLGIKTGIVSGVHDQSCGPKQQDNRGLLHFSIIGAFKRRSCNLR